MRLLVASDARFARDAAGAVFALGAEDYAFWAPYLEGFDEVRILGRVSRLAPPAHAARADGTGVGFSPLDDYRGPCQYLARLPRLRRQARRAVAECDAFLLRVPGAVGFLAADKIRRRGLPFAVEVLGDPWEALGPHGPASIWRPLARRWSRRRLRLLCCDAGVASYVTASLQNRYPTTGRAFTLSDVRLRPPAAPSQLETRRARLERAAAGHSAWHIGFVGSLETLYKAPDVLLEAAALCRRCGINCRLSLLGDGRCRPRLERVAADLGLGPLVDFRGAVAAGASVNAFLDSIDLFVLPSHTEGMPRALLEAMARGCPSIASSVGGIVELLDPQDLIEPGDPARLARRLAEVLRDPARLAAMSQRNLCRAAAFTESSLRPKRLEFLDELRRLTHSPSRTPNPRPPSPNVVQVATTARFWPFLAGQLGYLQARGFAIHLISSPGLRLDRFAAQEGLSFSTVPMSRGITPLDDLVALWRLWRLLRRLGPGMIHAHTPKAGLLSLLAARLAGVPVRIYTLHGLVWQARRGARRWILQGFDRLACRLATRVLSVAPSIRRAALEARLAPPEKIVVPASGSVNGLDFERFDARRVDPQNVSLLRIRYGIPKTAPVAAFVGRLAPDKGIAELEAAWQTLRRDFPSLHLLLVGELDSHHALPAPLLARLLADPRVHLTGWRDDMPEHYALMDICVVPSRREGLPYAALEAAAMERAVAAFAIDGVTDVVVDGVTGLLAPPGVPADLAASVARLLVDPALRARFGREARRRAEARYNRLPVWQAIHHEYLAAGQAVASAVRRLRWKHPLDLLLATGLVLLFAPLLLLLGLAVWVDLGPPILFRQRRIGLASRPFEILKFRTMRDDRDAHGRLLPDRPRLTPLGRLLRRASLDELPQLFNILRGDMSFIGPRPLLDRYLAFYTPEERRRHQVRPGLSGWAQIHGRNNLPWNERLALDVWYVDHASLPLDARIALATIWKTLARQGARDDPASAMLDLDQERPIA